MRHIELKYILIIVAGASLWFSACAKPSKSGLTSMDTSLLEEVRQGQFDQVPESEVSSFEMPDTESKENNEFTGMPKSDLNSGLNNTLDQMQGAASAYVNSGMNSPEARAFLFAAYCNADSITDAASASAPPSTVRGIGLGGLGGIGRVMGKSKARMGGLLGSAMKGGGSSMIMGALSGMMGGGGGEEEEQTSSFDQAFQQAYADAYARANPPAPSPTPASTQHAAKLDALCSYLKSSSNSYSYSQVGRMLPPPYQTLSPNAAGMQLYDTYQGVNLMNQQLFYR